MQSTESKRANLTERAVCGCAGQRGRVPVIMGGGQGHNQLRVVCPFFSFDLDCFGLQIFKTKEKNLEEKKQLNVKDKCIIPWGGWSIASGF